MEIVVQHRQVLNNEEVFDRDYTYDRIEDLRRAIIEIVEKWSNMHGNDTMITFPKVQFKVGTRIVLTCAANNDIETFEIKDIILADYS